MRKIPSCLCCYLIRLDEPLSNQRHSVQYYLGSCANLKKRFELHLKGTGTAFTRAAVEKGITFEVIYVWRTKTKREARQLEIK
ncbi:MAG: GIY-YIG nuclease family protein [Rivularia sp. (in: cyanobacteria)]